MNQHWNISPKLAKISFLGKFNIKVRLLSWSLYHLKVTWNIIIRYM